jgi:acetyl esterase
MMGGIKEKKMSSIFCKIRDFCRITLLILLMAALSFAGAQQNPASPDRETAQPTEAPSRVKVLKGTVAHAPAKGLVLFYGHDRRTADLDANGSFCCSLELQAPVYVQMEFEFQKGRRLIVFLLPGRSSSLDCDAKDIFGTVRFSGGGAAENNGLSLLQVHYDRIDYGKLGALSPADFIESVRSQQKELEKLLVDYTSTHPGLDPWFQRMEQARLTYWGAMARLVRNGLQGDWAEYASKLDFNDPSFLGINTYASFLRQYLKTKAMERIASDPSLKASINQQAEAQYAVALETFTDPTVRNNQLHEILRMQFDEDDLGPFGCKGIEKLMARFDRDCSDKSLREDIDRRYRQCLEGRNAPLIRVYKTVGTTSLDAHIFPASGAKPGEKRPAFLFFHGGGWAAGMPEFGYRQGCKRYAEKGLVGITFEYRLRWRHGATPLDGMEDAKSAVRWVRVHACELGVDPERIAVAGFSAGGHLAATTVMIADHDDPRDDKAVSSAPNALILMSTPINSADDPWFRECFGGRGDPAECSPAQYVRPGLPPMIVFHGLEDPLCPFPKTEAFCKNMRDAGNRCELYAFHGGHFRSQGDWAIIYEKTDEFLASLGFLDTSAKPGR